MVLFGWMNVWFLWLVGVPNAITPSPLPLYIFIFLILLFYYYYYYFVFFSLYFILFYESREETVPHSPLLGYWEPYIYINYFIFNWKMLNHNKSICLLSIYLFLFLSLVTRAFFFSPLLLCIRVILDISYKVIYLVHWGHFNFHWGHFNSKMLEKVYILLLSLFLNLGSIMTQNVSRRFRLRLGALLNKSSHFDSKSRGKI